MNPEAAERIAAFRRYLARERRLSVHTDSNYARDLAALTQFCRQQGIEDWPQLGHDHVRLFAARSHAAGLGPRSIQRRLSAVRSFLNFLIREGVLRHNCAVEVRAPKGQRRLPVTLDADTMGRLLEIPTEDVLAIRDRAIMELLYSSGLRLAELVGLDLPDLRFADRTVQVLGKGNKARVVPVGGKALAALTAWLEARRDLVREGNGAVFVGTGGRRLGARAIQKRVGYWAVRQGLPMHVHPHLFRHSFASHLLESSGQLRAVQELLGHADIATTQVYTHLDFQHLARIYDATHPRARKKA
ncbi:MAG TPA: tyrosine recombinase XerC [Steroidobacteraceae bacterium]|nr:tyrosine recombinase XerC [Steroidobacteraceae bacterium]